MEPDLARLKIQALLYRAPSGIDANVLRGALTRSNDVDPAIELADKVAWGTDRLATNFPEFRPTTLTAMHPLSGEFLPVGVDDLERLNGSLLATCSSLAGQFETAPEKLFHRIWWDFPRALAGSIPSQRLEWLPVDARLPARAWRTHATLTSALASCLADGGEPALLQFTITSAQDFISAARRTQDYWMGSFVLSWLSWEAIQLIADRWGPDCVLLPSLRGHPLVAEHYFPHMKSRRPTSANFANIFTALVPVNEAARIATKCADRVRTKWREMASSVRSTLEDAIIELGSRGAIERSSLAGADGKWQKAWSRQISDSEEIAGSQIFWSVVPWQVRISDLAAFGHDYTKFYDRGPLELQFQSRLPDDERAGLTFFATMRAAGQAVEARKHLRDFRQSEEPGWKCSLCGAREILGAGREARPVSLWAALANFESVKRSGLKLKGRIRPEEALCAPCVTKRLAWEFHFQKDHHLFSSTSSVAAAPFMQAVMNSPELRSDLRTYVERTKKLVQALDINRPETPLAAFKYERDGLLQDFLKLGGDWLYTESYEPQKLKHENRLDDDYVRTNASLIREARAGLARMLGHARELARVRQISCGRPSDYLALLYLDGDRLGEWLSGRRGLTLPQRVRGVELDPLLGDQNLPKSPAHTLAVAEALGTFSTAAAPALIEQEIANGEPAMGLLIYSGGDEVLAMAPVAQGLRMAEALRKAFQSQYVDQGLVMGASSSISGGVVIAHRESPLSEAVEAAHRAAEIAKARLNRDALTVQWSKRAGAPLEIVLPWGIALNGTAVLTIDYLGKLARLVRDGIVTRNMVTAAARIMRMLPTERGASSPDLLADIVRWLSTRPGRSGRMDAASRTFMTRELPEFLNSLEHEIAERITAVAPRKNARAMALQTIHDTLLAARLLSAEL